MQQKNFEPTVSNWSAIIRPKGKSLEILVMAETAEDQVALERQFRAVLLGECDGETDGTGNADV